ncbi:MAG TPA: serine hydrolase domain-containing protein [Kiritimatiellia bacterium]|nr:serine hydrolase domain-containing protein [Kiritimatiellia bacterium]HRZ12641.1 serine hydrolase domain-containing protein [Kiritimatiellia bacterium]HSA19591.1 serine hydrolase domain-containing protein [Kiritimatiellia bacterium]
MTRRVGFLVFGLLPALLLPAAKADITSDLQEIADGLVDQGSPAALLHVEDSALGTNALASGVRYPNEIIEGESVTGELAAAHTMWFHCATVSGQYYGVVVTGFTADVSLQLVNESLGFVTNRSGGWTGWTSQDDGGYDVGLSSTGNTPFVLRFYSFTNTIARATQWITEQMEMQDVVGLSVALVDGQEIAWARGFGYADLENGIPVTTDTVFRVGSVAKLFTATAALQYHDQDELGLDDPVTNHLPGLRLLYRYPETDSITVRDLLDHHSGLPGDLINSGFTTEPVVGRYAWLTNCLVTTYPIYPPRLIFSYCNSSFTLMEGVIEAVDGSGAPFTTLVASNLFEPLGMEATSFLKDKPAIVSQLAKPYIDGQAMPEEYANIYGTGGMYSRPVDLAQYIRMILAGGVAPGGTRVLGTDSVAEMLTPQATNAPFAPFAPLTAGLGWEAVEWPPLKYAGNLAFKSGWTMVYHANVAALPERDLGFAITLSSPAYIEKTATDFVLKHAVSDRYGIPVPTNTVYFPGATQAVSQAELDALAGVYATGDGYHRVESHPGSLTLVLNAESDEAKRFTNMLLRADGWFSPGASPTNGMLITNIAGRTMLVWRIAYGGSVLTNLHCGERVNPAPLSAAWSNRLGKAWFVLDESPAGYSIALGTSTRLTFTNRDGVLLVQCDYVEGSQVLSPTNDNTAFVSGLINRGDSAVQVFTSNTFEYLRYCGYTFQPAESFPVLYPGSMTNLSLAAGETRWFAVPGWTGDPQGLTITNASAPLRLNLYTPEGYLLGRGTSALPWICPTGGTYYLSVGAMNNASGNLRAYSLTNTIAKATEQIEGLMVSNGVVGLSVALVDGQEIAWARGFGYADRENGIPVTTDTVFRIGSVSKVFTTTAALQYRDRGKLGLDDSITNYLPGLRLLDRGGFPGTDAVTVRDLLDHHSGLPGDLLNSSMTTEPFGGRFAWLTNYLAGTYPVYPPRLVNSYCNSGFVLMEGVVEAADGSGTPFTDLMSSNLFEPLGMDASSILKDKPDITNHLARPYVNEQVMPEEFINIHGTGGMYSRPVDLAQYIRMILAGGVAPDGTRILETNSVAEMLTPQATNAPLEPFVWETVGLGWDTVRSPELSYAGDLAWKNGITTVYRANMAVLPNRDLGFAITVSSPAAFAGGPLYFVLQQAVSDKYGIPVPTNTVYFPAATQAVSQAELDALAGIYAAGDGYHRVESQPGSLTLVLNAHSDEPPPDGSRVVVTNLCLRTDGWFSVGSPPSFSIVITNIAERTALAYRQASGALSETSLIGERFNPEPLPAAWSNRLGKAWYVLDESPVSYFVVMGFSPRLAFTNRDALLLVQSEYTGGSHVLSPTNDNVAFVCGLVNAEDSAVQVFTSNTFEYLRLAGYTWQPEDSIPELTPGVPVSGTNLSTQCNWYRADLPVGTFTLTCSDTNIRMIVYGGMAAPVIAIGSYTFAQTASGSVYVALGTMSSSVPYELDAGRATLILERIEGGPSGMAFTWISQPGTNYTVEVATNLCGDPAFAPLASNLPSSDEIVTTWTAAPPASALEFYRVRLPP